MSAQQPPPTPPNTANDLPNIPFVENPNKRLMAPSAAIAKTDASAASVKQDLTSKQAAEHAMMTMNPVAVDRGLPAFGIAHTQSKTSSFKPSSVDASASKGRADAASERDTAVQHQELSSAPLPARIISTEECNELDDPEPSPRFLQGAGSPPAKLMEDQDTRMEKLSQCFQHRLVNGQHYPFKFDTEQTEKMTRFAVNLPEKRLKAINNGDSFLECQGNPQPTASLQQQRRLEAAPQSGTSQEQARKASPIKDTLDQIEAGIIDTVDFENQVKKIRSARLARVKKAIEINKDANKRASLQTAYTDLDDSEWDIVSPVSPPMSPFEEVDMFEVQDQPTLHANPTHSPTQAGHRSSLKGLTQEFRRIMMDAEALEQQVQFQKAVCTRRLEGSDLLSSPILTTSYDTSTGNDEAAVRIKKLHEQREKIFQQMEKISRQAERLIQKKEQFLVADKLSAKDRAVSMAKVEARAALLQKRFSERNEMFKETVLGIKGWEESNVPSASR